MALSFPNDSRSYDTTHRRVRFLGYDGVMEVAFFLLVDALFRIDPSARGDEGSILRAFDANRARIQHAAARAYGASRRHSYMLAAADL